jgi:hypothetical protein
VTWKPGETSGVGSADDVETGRAKAWPANRFVDRIRM